MKKKPEGVENEAHEQVAFADVLVMNKTDLVTRKEIDALKEKIKSINIHAPIIESQFSKVPIDKVINIGAFDLEQTLKMDDAFLDIESEHKHDTSISSFGIHIEGSFIMNKLNTWLQNLMRTKGADLYRSKGILAIRGTNDKYVFQGVHMLLNFGRTSDFGMDHKPWGKNEKRMNKFCFIGKDLDKDKMIAELKECIFDGKIPAPGPKPQRNLRFDIGDTVLCKCADWVRGRVTKHWYREELWATGRYAPYQVLLDDGGLIWVPRDIDAYIKKPF